MIIIIIIIMYASNDEKKVFRPVMVKAGGLVNTQAPSFKTN